MYAIYNVNIVMCVCVYVLFCHVTLYYINIILLGFVGVKQAYMCACVCMKKLLVMSPVLPLVHIIECMWNESTNDMYSHFLCA